MQLNITHHCVKWTVEFDESGEVDALYIGGQDVTHVIADITKAGIYELVSRNAARWHDEYLAQMAAEERQHRMAA